MIAYNKTWLRNIAIVKKPSESTVCQYEIRYFGFDFSNTNYQIPETLNSLKPSPNLKNTHRILTLILNSVLQAEYGYDNFEIGLNSPKNRQLCDELIQYCKEKLEIGLLSIEKMKKVQRG